MSVQRLLTECLAKIPGVTVSDQNSAILDTFQMNPEDPFIPALLTTRIRRTLKKWNHVYTQAESLLTAP
jgi:hypothetical protein